MGAMAQAMNPAITQALVQAEHLVEARADNGERGPLARLVRPADSVIARIMRDTQAKPLAMGLKQQLAQAVARLRSIAEPDERRAQMRLVADLQARLGLEARLMNTLG